MFTLALQNDNISLSRSLKEEIAVVRDDLQVMNSNIANINLRQTDQESRAIFRWLSPLDFTAKHIDVSQKRRSGTGEWLLLSDQFGDWVRGRSKVLWCPGMPGAGKTTLASLIIDHLESTLQHGTVGIAYIYCSYTDTEHTAINLVGSILRQLVRVSAKSPNPPHFYKRHLK